jgi:hypothetical protein
LIRTVHVYIRLRDAGNQWLGNKLQPNNRTYTPKIMAQDSPPPIKKKFISREDIATVFHHGARALTRNGAVIWPGGSTPATVRVGQGIIKDRIADHRNNPEVQA